MPSREWKTRAIAKEYDFQPSAIARNLSLRSSHTIAFVNHAYSKDSCAISDPFCLEIMGGIASRIVLEVLRAKKRGMLRGAADSQLNA